MSHWIRRVQGMPRHPVSRHGVSRNLGGISSFLIGALLFLAGPGRGAPPLTPQEASRLEKVLEGRSCSCPCSQTLKQCFGCTVAKTELGLALEGIRAGETPESIRERLDRPVVLVLWMDHTHEASRAAARSLQALEEHWRSLVKVVLRHHPGVHPDASSGLARIDPATPDSAPAPPEIFRQVAVALELAREQELFDLLHQAFITRTNLGNKDQILEELRRIGIEPLTYEGNLESGRYEAQIDRDLESASEDYRIEDRHVPVLYIDDELYEGPLTTPAITRAIEARIRETSY